MRLTPSLLLAALVAGPAFAQAPVTTPKLQAITAQVQEAELRNTITTLVGFGTRHTASDTKSDTRGIGAARRWAQGRFEAISKDCGGCLTIVKPDETVTAPRLPNPTVVQDVVAIKRGTTDPDRVIVITGHIDSINSVILNATDDAPGANDDGSGVSVVLEAARILSKMDFPATLVFSIDSGEEQGLFGGRVIAAYAKRLGWQVEADLNNDIVGNIHGLSGVIDNTHVRVFSEGVRAADTAANVSARASTGGELDSPSREVARFIDRIADQTLLNFDVRMIYRTDRYGRGGDQSEFLAQGFPAVRFTEGVENFDRQHQTVRNLDGRQYGDLITGVDFNYLAQVARLNIAAMAALAMAPAPPLEVTLKGGVTPDTNISWTAVPGAVGGYRVWWRDTTEPRWQYSRAVPAGQTSLALPGFSVDNSFFGVASVAADGSESPVEFPGQVGAFFPVANSTPKPPPIQPVPSH
jgi:acetylornithine deacetylase/succinyl-diaminopimelate desuccinylase-like protein